MNLPASPGGIPARNGKKNEGKRGLGGVTSRRGKIVQMERRREGHTSRNDQPDDHTARREDDQVITVYTLHWIFRDEI